MALPTCECIDALPQADKLSAIYCALLENGTSLEGPFVVTGPYEDNAPAASFFPVLIGGKAVDAAGYAPAYTAGDAVQAAFDTVSGGLLVKQQLLTSADTVTTATQGYSAQVDITRPANATPYTAGDVLGGAITIPTIGPSAGRIILTNLALLPQVVSIPAGMTSFRLHLYSVTPPSALADNAPWTFTSVDWPSYLGYVDLGSPVDFGAALFVQATQVNQEIKLASTSVFGYLVTNGGFTPAGNSEVYRLDTYAVSV